MNTKIIYVIIFRYNVTAIFHEKGIYDFEQFAAKVELKVQAVLSDIQPANVDLTRINH